MHKFGILMERVTFLKPFGAPEAPQIFFLFYFTASEGGGCPNGCRRRPNGGDEGAQRRHAPGGRGRSRRRREFSSIYEYLCECFFFTVNKIYIYTYIHITSSNYRDKNVGFSSLTTCRPQKESSSFVCPESSAMFWNEWKMIFVYIFEVFFLRLNYVETP